MTILHNDEPLSMKGVYPESHNCIDCGYNTAPGCPPRELAEFLMNRDGNVPMTYTRDFESLHRSQCRMESGGHGAVGRLSCIPCLERRIERRLRPKDFECGHPLNWSELPCTERLRDRREGAAIGDAANVITEWAELCSKAAEHR